MRVKFFRSAKERKALLLSFALAGVFVAGLEASKDFIVEKLGLTEKYNELLAKREAKTLKEDKLLTLGGFGDCRIRNTLEAMKNKDLYVVLGKVKDLKTGREGWHEWTTTNAIYPADRAFIVDKTTGLNKDRVEYMAGAVIKLDRDTCKVELTDFKLYPANIIKAGAKYVETFCKEYRAVAGRF